MLDMRDYPEPFDESIEAQPQALVDAVEGAHAIARSEYGDEGEGYDLNLMVKVLLDQGWTPPEDLT